MTDRGRNKTPYILLFVYDEKDVSAFQTWNILDNFSTMLYNCVWQKPHVKVYTYMPKKKKFLGFAISSTICLEYLVLPFAVLTIIWTFDFSLSRSNYRSFRKCSTDSKIM